MEVLDFDKKSEIQEDNLFFSIWTKPRATLRYILNFCPKKYLSILLILGSISQSIDRAALQNLGDELPVVTILISSILVGGVIGWAFYLLFSEIIIWTGRWFEGDANSAEVKTAMAWSSIPAIVSTILLVPQLLLLKGDYFKTELTFQPSLFVYLITVALSLIEIILAVWSLVLFVITLAEVQLFSIKKAILNIAVAVLVVAVPLVLFTSLFLGIVK